MQRLEFYFLIKNEPLQRNAGNWVCKLLKVYTRLEWIITCLMRCFVKKTALYKDGGRNRDRRWWRWCWKGMGRINNKCINSICRGVFFGFYWFGGFEGFFRFGCHFALFFGRPFSLILQGENDQAEDRPSDLSNSFQSYLLLTWWLSNSEISSFTFWETWEFDF